MKKIVKCYVKNVIEENQENDKKRPTTISVLMAGAAQSERGLDSLSRLFRPMSANHSGISVPGYSGSMLISTSTKSQNASTKKQINPNVQNQKNQTSEV